MVTSAPVLSPATAERMRRLSLVAAAAAGIAAAGIVLASQEVADFLREGPARVTGLHGDTLRALFGLGTLAAASVAVAGVWSRAFAARLAIAGAALAGGLFLVHALFIPAATLIAIALGADLAQRLPRRHVERFAPRRMPLLWAGAGVVGIAALAGVVWLSVWLLEPLFDDGTRLEEEIGFVVEGVDTTTPGMSDPDAAVDPAPASAASAAAEDDPAAQPRAEAATPAAAANSASASAGTLISQGVLQGVDSFHTGSGDVLVLRDPAGGLILRFQDYAVRNGPDLHVYLTPDPAGDVHAEGAIDLGPVRATSGSVNYAIPDGVDPSLFGAAVIYCQPFAVTFAVAPLALQ